MTEENSQNNTDVSLPFPMGTQSKSSIEGTVFNSLQANLFKGGLPVLTAVPTYSGKPGETVWVKTGVNPNEAYSLYAYIEDNATPPVFAWRVINPSLYELLSNKVTTINGASTDTEYPSAQAVYELWTNPPVDITWLQKAGIGAGGGNVTHSITFNNSDNTLLIVALTSSSALTINTVTWDGVNLTKLVETATFGTDSLKVSLWYLRSPNYGASSKSLTVNGTDAGGGYGGGIACFYKYTDISTQMDNSAAQTSATTTDYSKTLTTTNDKALMLLVGAVEFRDAVLFPDTGTVIRGTNTSFGFEALTVFFAEAGSVKTPAGNVTLGINSASYLYCGIMASIKAQ